MNAVCNSVTNGVTNAVRISSRPEPDQNQIVLTSAFRRSWLTSHSFVASVKRTSMNENGR